MLILLSATPTKRRQPASSLNICAVLLLLVGASAAAQDTDLAGSTDHVAISRYAGSVIIGYDFREFDELVIPLSRVEITYPPGAAVAKKSQKIEGRATRLLYVAPPQRSTLEVLRNYEQELKKAGFQTLFACVTTACSPQTNGMISFLYPSSRSQTLKGQDLPLVLTMPQEQRYIAAKRASEKGDLYASVLVAKDTNPGVPRTNDRSVVLLEVIETASMDTGLVTIDASAMAKEIEATGHIALYGIHFDTNRAELKAESDGALLEIATLLKQDTNLRLLVVGHTDNVGGFDANMALSERRAAAVLHALTTKHGVAAARLRAVGVGMAAPVATNETEEGRAKNRRVDLVRQ
jgi:outer membrane protein OmpA-like peptidoglycan-associated protein